MKICDTIYKNMILKLKNYFQLLIYLNFLQISIISANPPPGSQTVEAKYREQKYKQMKNANSTIYQFFSIVCKSVVSSFTNAISTEVIEALKIYLKSNSFIYDLNQMTDRYLDIYKVPQLQLTSEQFLALNQMQEIIISFCRTGRKENIMNPFFLGASGTGKTSILLNLLVTLKEEEILYSKENPSFFSGQWRSFVKILPKFICVFFNLQKTSRTLSLLINATHFLKQNGDADQAALKLRELLQIGLKSARNGKLVFFVFEECKPLLQDPFSRVIQETLDAADQLNKNKKGGLFIMGGSLNDMDNVSSHLCRRIDVIVSNVPPGSNKVKTFVYYLEQYLQPHMYTSVILKHTHKWVMYCELFSNSDMENLVLSLKLMYSLVKRKITLMDLLMVINREWVKKKIIMEKQEKTFQELDLVLYKAAQFLKNMYNIILEDPELNFDNVIIEITEPIKLIPPNITVFQRAIVNKFKIIQNQKNNLLFNNHTQIKIFFSKNFYQRFQPIWSRCKLYCQNKKFF
jgi:Cdc6-like AAA superfamily ATPase